MVKPFLIILTFLFLSYSSSANIFDFGMDKKDSDEAEESRMNLLIDKIKKLNFNQTEEFEERFNEFVKAIETIMEEEKSYCNGETTNKEGKTLSPSKKQFCMRELKNKYLEATRTIFDIKKRYLGHLHQKQLNKLAEIEASIKSEIEKNF